jgi:hypothetical protein
MTNTDLQQPNDLSTKGKQAHKAIVAFLEKHKLTYTGGCRAFYSPKEWTERGEEYGCDSELVIVHDGGNVGDAFSYDSENYGMIEEMNILLKPLGVYSEPCTRWYTAIYLA